jgi:hypothetical protein
VKMMLRGIWLSGVSDAILAEKWNCSAANVRQISAEAARVIRARMRDDPEAQKEARAMILAGFEAIRARGMLNGDAQSMRVALDAMRAYAHYMGIEPAPDLPINRSTPVDSWTLEEKLAYARDGRKPQRAFGRLSAERAANGEDKGRVH